jgi:carboxymethylenebutenolidase
MSIKAEWIGYGGDKGYFAMPEHAGQPLPAVIVIADIMGVSDQTEDVVKRIAAAGYAALAPDFYVSDGKRPPHMMPERIGEAMNLMRTLGPGAWGDHSVLDAALAKMPEPERVRVHETFSALFSGMTKNDAYLTAIRNGVKHLRKEKPETKDQKVGCVGFCMGGGLSALLACEEPEVSAAAVFYGNTPAPEKLAKINCPVIAFYGEKDPRVNAGIDAFADGMKKAGKPYEHYIYKGAGHAFFNDYAASYEVNAVRDSYARLLAFFRKNLSS